MRAPVICIMKPLHRDLWEFSQGDDINQDMNKHEDSDISDITDALDEEMMTDEHDNINETMAAEAELLGTLQERLPH